jgi:hypothetical protein
VCLVIHLIKIMPDCPIASILERHAQGGKEEQGLRSTETRKEVKRIEVRLS